MTYIYTYIKIKRREIKMKNDEFTKQNKENVRIFKKQQQEMTVIEREII
jgi:hypothetical protein